MHILKKGEYKSIDCKNILLSIWKEVIKVHPIRFAPSFLIGFLQIFIPVVLHYGFSVPIFSSWSAKASYGLGALPLFAWYGANVLLFTFTYSLLKWKQRSLEAILQMIDQKQRYRTDVLRQYPIIHVFAPHNLHSFINMTRVVQNMTQI